MKVKEDPNSWVQPAPDSTEADKYFLFGYPLHPMVMAFIHFPVVNKNVSEFATQTARPIRVEANSVSYEEGIDLRTVPWGLPVRKILLYFFSQFYRDPNFRLRMKVQSKEFLNLFGYNKRVYREKDRVMIAFLQFLYCSFQFRNSEDNVKVGYKSFEQNHLSKMLDAKVHPDGTFEMWLNPDFMF